MLRKALIIGSTMVVIGGAVLTVIHSGERKRREAAEVYRSRYDAELSEYMRKYDGWSGLSPDEQAISASRTNTQPGAETPERLAMERYERLAAHADELTAGDPNAQSFGDALYGTDWEHRLEKQRRRREWAELAATGSIVVVGLGGTILGACVVVLLSRGLAWILLRGMGSTHRLLTVASRRRKHETVGLAPPVEPAYPAGWSVMRNKHGRLCVQEDPAAGPGDSPPPALDGSLKDTVSGRRSIAPVIGHAQIELGPLAPPASAQTVSPSNAKSDEALSTLTDLSEQVSAIRQYVACQQNRVEQLQDGWAILRPLCLRVIRCIDNIDDRVQKLPGGDVSATPLGDIRDELLFALESSGVEQYTPDINSPYRGQEKYAEAVKDKQTCKDPQRKGAIARVVRPGYQYFVDEEHVKVVRTAQVKLYG